MNISVILSGIVQQNRFVLLFRAESLGRSLLPVKYPRNSESEVHENIESVQFVFTHMIDDPQYKLTFSNNE